MRVTDRVASAVVLAAGKGVRLWPLTEGRSKHMIPIAGKPVIEHVALAIRSAGLRNLIVVTGYQEELIRKCLGDGKRLGLKIEYAHQSDISGTASALAVAREYLGDKDFVTVYGDVLVKAAAIKRVLNTYGRKRRRPTVGLVPVSHPESYGMARIAGEWITEIVEKPQASASPSNLANAGIYVLNQAILDHLENAPRSGRGEFEITDAISSLARGGGAVAWSRIEASDWRDIGRPWDLLFANADLLARLRRSVKGTIEKRVTILGRVIVENDAIIKTGTIIEGPAWIGGRAIVGPFAHIRAGASIGRGAMVGNFCEIKNSIIMDGTRIQHLSYVGDSVIGEKCNLGAGTMVANVKSSGKTVRMRIRDTIEDTGLRKLGVFTGDGIRTGVNSSIMPGVRIASGAVVPAGSVVSEDFFAA